MITHRSHTAKKHAMPHHASNAPSKETNSPADIYPLYPVSDKESDKDGEKEVETPFLAWPYFLFEKISKPWRNAVSPVSWVDSWHVGDRVTVPKTQSSETEKEYLYQIELPDVPRDQIVLNFQNGSIMLRVVLVDNRRSKRSQQKHLHVIRRAFSLPVYTDGEAITARLRNGVLSITIPKTDIPIPPKSRIIDIT